MTLKILSKRTRFGGDVKTVEITDAKNIEMNEIGKNNNSGTKTFTTDGLATCAAICIYGSKPPFPTAFTHMSSASTNEDDARKERDLDEMLQYVLENSGYNQVKIMISPPGIKEEHLMSFIQNWTRKHNLEPIQLKTGNISAVFNIDEKGEARLISTLFNNSKIEGGKFSAKGCVTCDSKALDMNTRQKNTTDISSSFKQKVIVEKENNISSEFKEKMKNILENENENENENKPTM